MKKTQKSATESSDIRFRVVTEEKERRMSLGSIAEQIADSDIVKVWRKTYERPSGNLTVVVVYTKDGRKMVYNAPEGSDQFSFVRAESCVIEQIKAKQ